MERKIKMWRSGAIRELLELENAARKLRDLLEDDPRVDLGALAHEVADINSHTMTLTSYHDRASGLAEAGL